MALKTWATKLSHPTKALPPVKLRAILARILGIANFSRGITRPGQYSIAFQSRLGRAKWLEPYTEQTLKDLAAKGVKKLLVLCPAFVTDCLETLEEIEMQGAETFKHAGGESLTLVPCMNAHPAWVDTVARWVQE